MANYVFSARAHDFIKSHSPCVALCFDVSGFFDNLDHAILKNRLKRLLSLKEITKDWHQVFKRATRYSFIEKACLEAHYAFGKRIRGNPDKPIATIRQVIDAGIDIFSNENRYGIPQGTPISSALSNLYMLDIDREMSYTAGSCGALYQRYSDDILLICSPSDENDLRSLLENAISAHKLKLNNDKSERAEFDGRIGRNIQYLGFNLSESDVVIRQSSLAKKWRSAKRSIRRINKIGSAAVASGKATKIYTAALHKRFQPIGVRNFSLYARLAAKSFGSRAILKQIRRLERMIGKILCKMNPPKTK